MFFYNHGFIIIIIISILNSFFRMDNSQYIYLSTTIIIALNFFVWYYKINCKKKKSEISDKDKGNFWFYIFVLVFDSYNIICNLMNM